MYAYGNGNSVFTAALEMWENSSFNVARKLIKGIYLVSACLEQSISVEIPPILFVNNPCEAEGERTSVYYHLANGSLSFCH
jgi:hypothetical protein